MADIKELEKFEALVKEMIYRIRNHEASGAVSAENISSMAENGLKSIGEWVCSLLTHS